MKHLFEPFLSDSGVVILDGAMATELERRGADLDDPLWSAKLLLESPYLIREVHHDYLVAGADILITASYQASIEGFTKRGLSAEQAEGLIGLSVELAKQAREDFWEIPANKKDRQYPLIAGSVGCYGASLADGSEYRGNYGLGITGLMDFHRPRIRALLAAGPDLLACETLPSLLEAEALVQLLKDDFPDATAWLSFTCEDGSTTREGHSIADCAKLADRAQNIIAVGVNCTSPQHVSHLVTAIRSETSKPIVVYPNSGETWDAEHKCWQEDTDSTDFAHAAKNWHEQGASVIGGCCRTTPSTIQNIAQALRPTSKPSDEP